MTLNLCFMHLIVYEKKVYVYVYVYICTHAGLQQHSTATLPKAGIPQDTSTSRPKRRGKPIQQAIPRMAMVRCRNPSSQDCQISYK
ncbi:protein of unknown function [Candidatus Nitrosotalea okcheonensis]|uniref:Uncharacterized protein n=1 Tax=Candidatus Nitrosotalea okcheonensis TaxID=1903276 RepID=A0A2H1FE75_9ARCH|nr:protein of unknown function [Candidatus Nitrosotalea okcheonensis]